MSYDFDTLIDRRSTFSVKWDVLENELPMWVADMDFKTAPEIIDALEKRVSHGIFGYTTLPCEWYDSICEWWRERHGLDIQSEWLMFSTGVVSSVSSIIRKLTTPGENVLLQTPVYNAFFTSILNNGRHIIDSPLLYNEGAYSIDFEDLERKLADPQTTLMILCNPHNPIGKLWSKDELERIGELCIKHHVVVLADEIHCDLTDPGCEYIPFASVSERCANNSVTCIAPTKTFNLAGIQTSAVAVPNPVLRHKVWRGLNTDEVGEPNCFAVEASIAAYTKGAPWLEELKAYLYENKLAVREYLTKELPDILLVPSQATYLLWLDCSHFTNDSEEFADFIRKETGLFVTAGSHYHGEGKKFLRMNIACPRARVMEGLERLKAGIRAYARNS